MKKLIILSLTACLTILLSGQKSVNEPGAIHDKMRSFTANSIKISGYLGDKINLIIDQRIKTQSVDALVEPFRYKDETHLWQSEFWGKWILSAISSYDYNHDPAMLAIIQKAVHDLLATQLSSGYIGNYSDSARLLQWDIWGRKYTLLGLLSYYDLTGDKAVLKEFVQVG